MNKQWNILVLNLGSTSSKVAYYKSEEIVEQSEEQHDTKELRELKTPETILAYYKKIVFGFIDRINLNLEELDAIAVRGTGKWGAYKHGAYLLSQKLGDDVRGNTNIGHLGLYSGTMIGDELSKKYNIPAYLYDVVPTDEVPDIATITGIAGYRRRVASHTLNCRACARRVAERMGLDPGNSTFLIAHMGGGFCSLAYKDGIIIETNAAGDGSFTPERAGLIPSAFLTEVYTNPKYTEQDRQRMLRRDVGLYGHLGTSNCIEVEEMINNGDKKAKLVYEAMAYQVSRDIGSLAPVVGGKVDAIILTGGIAHSKMITGWITERVGFIAPVEIVPGAIEMEALAGGVTRVLNGEEEVNSYEDVREHFLFENL
ncbi:MAG: butyrate kinase [Oscillospiraceae bacterium]|nr:butyrate kinase [Oscillospiraceae bacterium]